MTIEASRVVPATPEAVFQFLSKLENHWRLAGRWVEPLELNSSSGRVRMHGPLGLRRTATTTVVEARPSSLLRGTAALSGGTRAAIAWELREDAGGTSVKLSADLEQATAADRALLALGGAAWMRRHFAAILDRLAAAVT